MEVPSPKGRGPGSGPSPVNIYVAFYLVFVNIMTLFSSVQSYKETSARKDVNERNKYMFISSSRLPLEIGPSYIICTSITKTRYRVFGGGVVSVLNCGLTGRPFASSSHLKLTTLIHPRGPLGNQRLWYVQMCLCDWACATYRKSRCSPTFIR